MHVPVSGSPLVYEAPPAVVEFRSRNIAQVLPFPDGRRVSFANGVYRTADRTEIALLRDVVACEARGNRAVTEAGTLAGGPVLSGTVRLTFDGYAVQTVYAGAETWDVVSDRIGALLASQEVQQALARAAATTGAEATTRGAAQAEMEHPVTATQTTPTAETPRQRTPKTRTRGAPRTARTPSPSPA